MSVFTNEVVGPLTDTELRALPVPVTASGTVTSNAGSGTFLVDGSAHTQPVSGTVTATGPLTDTQLRASPVAVTSTPQTNASATVAQVVLLANTSATLVAANASRIKAVAFIPAQPAYIKFGTTASNTSFTYKITANNTMVEFPIGYTGRIDILSQTGQTVNITEY